MPVERDPVATFENAVMWYHEEGGRVKHEGRVEIYDHWVRKRGPMGAWIPREKVGQVHER